MRSDDDAVKISVVDPKPTVSLEFASKEMLENFRNQMDSRLYKKTKVEGNKLIINQSKNSKDFGVYESLNGEVSIKCGDEKDSKKIMELLSIQEGRAAKNEGTGTIYFNKRNLPPDGTKTMETVIKDDAYKMIRNAEKLIVSAYDNSKTKKDFLDAISGTGSNMMQNSIKDKMGKIYDEFKSQKDQMNLFELLVDAVKSVLFGTGKFDAFVEKAQESLKAVVKDVRRLENKWSADNAPFVITHAMTKSVQKQAVEAAKGFNSAVSETQQTSQGSHGVTAGKQQGQMGVSK